MEQKELKLSNIEAITNALDLAMSKDNNVVIYGEDVGVEGGVFRTTKGLQAKYGKERV
jgi:pyruvate dehydrogenase E1 component beta subunit